ncbi:uncharacterized protein LOC110228397 isoform X2 [Arabidopsis lyrata subsp. lyrata]|uniref:uncharacterized protein LOC110228397 isoform X2 n=1 Tax=Arabidopsis lyrata subsp. lyrata TaxID=81972 RepID=UPI000A29AB2A|nr:uncharacterized protein LOC110228397 isoform X2 [Arabidopsis lyrata subsp. lyrata]|eukprot:XP_020881431.1 uncharacterized protein LOC110228397 isoform X2 [Arabidopsis lyrata subsp. lyrata]
MGRNSGTFILLILLYACLNVNHLDLYIVGKVQLERRLPKRHCFKQMGCLWRASKSRLVTAVRAAKSKTERLKLKPSNIHSDGRSVRPEFAETIEKIKSIDSDIGSTATTSLRKDVVSQVLGKDKPGRVRGLGRGVTATKLAFLQVSDSQVETLRSQIEALRNEVRNLAGKKCQSDDDSVSEDSDVKRGVSCQLLDWCAPEDVVVREAEYCSMDPVYKIGRIQLGPNAAAVIVKSVSGEDVSVWRPTETITSLVEAVGVKIAWPADKIVLHTEMDSPPENKNSSKATAGKILIYDWNMDDVVIGEGRLCSSDPKELVNNMPIGQGAAIVTVDKVFAENVYLWRPISAEILTIGNALHENIVWPIKPIELFSSEEKESAPQKQTSSKSLTNSDSSTGSASKKKCILLDCNDSGKEVAEGRVMSTNPTDKVHFVPLGHNASKIKVEVVKVGEAKVWKPNSEVEIIADAIGTTMAWPNDKLVFV